MPLRKGRHPQIKEVKILKHKKIMILALALLLLTVLCCTSALAAGGDVAGAVEQTWTEAAKQIKAVVEKVVFPALDMILAIAFFVKLGGEQAFAAGAVQDRGIQGGGVLRTG